MRPAEGATLAGGRYRFETHLGSGGMASVWRARDEQLDRAVAIKLMAEHLADDATWFERFTREAKAAAGLAHPHIVRVFDFGVEQHRPYIVMALLPGGTLKQRLEAGTGVPPAAQVARELLGALAHVHDAGLLHRDVKPGNLLLDSEDRTHLTDFGIARVMDATGLTETGAVLGTMRYLAPEVAQGEAATEASDLYAAGRVLRDLPDIDASPALEALVGRLTAKNPALRPPTARDALTALENGPAVRRGHHTGTTEVLATEATRRRAPSLPLAAALAAIALLALVVIAFAGGGDGESGGGSRAPTTVEQELRELDREIDAAR